MGLGEENLHQMAIRSFFLVLKGNHAGAVVVILRMRAPGTFEVTNNKPVRSIAINVMLSKSS